MSQLPSEQPAGPVRGLKCPKCGHGYFRLVWIVHRASHIQRRRQCKRCGHRITTREQKM